MNISILKGNICSDIAPRYTKSGACILDFSVAWNNRYKHPQTGKLTDDAHFFDCVAFGSTAETIAKFFEKGKPILLTCRLDQQRWTDDAQKKRSRVRLVVDRFDFCGEKRGSRDDGPPADYDDEPASEHDAHGVDIRQPAAPLPPTVNPPPAAADAENAPQNPDIPF